jgi:hypothetical protein
VSTEATRAKGALSHQSEAVLISEWWLRVCGKSRRRSGEARQGPRRSGSAIAGQALRSWGRLAEARDQLTAALAVLRADPDTDTVRALNNLASVEVAAGSPDAGRLPEEALTLGQALGVGDDELSRLLSTRGIYLAYTGRRIEAAAYFRESARLAGQAGDSRRLGLALLNLAGVLAGTEPGAAAEAARAAAGHARRAGDRDSVAFATANLAMALVMLGDWDAADAEFTQAADSDALAGYEVLACQRGWLAALRGDTAAAQAMLAGLADLRASEDLQDQALVSVAEGFTAAARRQPRAAPGHARAVLAHADAPGISHHCLRWAWPLAARAARDLGDAAAVGELLTLLDDHQPGHLAPMLRAERDLARARLAAADGGPDAAAALAAAISSMREQSTPCHLAHGLLDHAGYLTRLRDADAAALAVGEARTIAGRLRCGPLLDRAADLTPAAPPAPAATV